MTRSWPMTAFATSFSKISACCCQDSRFESALRIVAAVMRIITI